MKIVVIGAGYVGMAFGAEQAKNGHQVIATTRTPERLRLLENEGMKPVLLDAKDEKAVKMVIHGADYVVVTLASKGDSYEEAYFNTAKSIAQAVIEVTSVMQVVYTSSTSVYGDAKGDWVTEKSPCTPLNSSSEWLKKTEEVYLSLNPSVCSTILRLGEIYGPGREIKNRLSPGSVFPGTGENWTNLIHLGDIVRAVDFVIEKKLSGVWNLCQDTHTPRKELYQNVAKKEGLPSPLFDPAKKSVHSGNKRVSNAAIKNEGFIFTNNGIT